MRTGFEKVKAKAAIRGKWTGLFSSCALGTFTFAIFKVTNYLAGLHLLK